MPSFRKIDWYDLPRYYDIVYDVDTQVEVDFLEAVKERHSRARGKHVLEPACGSARLLGEFAKRGYQVSGFDQNESMLAYGRERLGANRDAVRLWQDDMATFQMGAPCHFAECLLSSFQYLLTEAEARSHLQCVANALVDGGVYVLGLHLADYADRGTHRETWRGQRGRTHASCTLRASPADPTARTQAMRSRLIVEEDGETRRYETNWSFRTYDDRELRGLLRTVPELELVEVYDYDLDLTRTHTLEDDRLDTMLVLRRVTP